MADTTTRVQQWRQRLKNEGKVPLTVYVGYAEKLRLEDLAATWHCSVSELTQQALAAFRPGSPAALGSATDTAHIRELIREELHTFLDKPTPGASVTETLQHVPVTDAPQQASQPLLDAADLDASPREAVAISQPPVLDYDPSKYTLGKLCPRGHDWQGTGKSFLRLTTHGCLACEREKAQARRAVQQVTPKAAEQAPLLAQLATWRAAGMSFKAITARLNTDGVPTVSGRGKWNPGTVLKLLRDAPEQARERRQAKRQAQPA